MIYNNLWTSAHTTIQHMYIKYLFFLEHIYFESNVIVQFALRSLKKSKHFIIRNVSEKETEKEKKTLVG